MVQPSSALGQSRISPGFWVEKVIHQDSLQNSARINAHLHKSIAKSVT